MAIRDPKDQAACRITITLKNGTVIGPADTTSAPFGESERIVCIWQGDSVMVYPIHQVDKVEMSFSA